jgi:hypothetical protein
VRHTLSLRVCFVRVDRAITDAGKGSYWTYEPSRGDGINRKRKPGKKKSTAAVAQESDQAREYIEVHDSSPDDLAHDDDRILNLPHRRQSNQSHTNIAPWCALIRPQSDPIQFPLSQTVQRARLRATLFP